MQRLYAAEAHSGGGHERLIYLTDTEFNGNLPKTDSLLSKLILS